MNIPKYFENFCNEYIKDNSYWYIPKGFSIKKENIDIIIKKLKILEKYEGCTWNDKVQTKIRKDLKNSGLSKNKVKNQSEDDKNALVRVFKVVTSTLGIAWINDLENIHITSVGKEILVSKNPHDIISNQVERFQFYNPSFVKTFDSIKLMPLVYLLSVISSLKDKYITSDEYILFISKKKLYEDVKKSVEEIESYRLLEDDDKESIKDFLDSKKIETDNNRRSSIFNTIRLGSSYAINFFTSSNMLNYKDNKIELAKTVKETLLYIKENRKIHTWVNFREHKDWFYYFGSSEYKSSIEFAMDYYADISDIENALKIYEQCDKNSLKKPNLSLDDFKSVLIDEKILEDFLEKHLEELETGLKFKGRQYRTISGPIDILAEDKNGNVVVIELKRGRASDKVIGQVARYVGYLMGDKKYKNKIRVIIVGKEIDRNLKIASSTLKVKCDLYQFDYKVKFDKVS